MCFCFEQLQSEVEKPLLTFRENFKKDMKRFDHHIADLRKQLASRYAAVEKVADMDVKSVLLSKQMDFRGRLTKIQHWLLTGFLRLPLNIYLSLSENLQRTIEHLMEDKKWNSAHAAKQRSFICLSQ